ncbi:hypothetical protein ACNPQM_12330 [Streptomyces sp. NPDC056231]|uniref:hypothetical protein n=1 Tax=Streptomyces sp. NPDC056231 TaxID=3345755 RepID=UPI003AAD5464
MDALDAQWDGTDLGPISPYYVTRISFAIYVVCRAVGAYRTRRWGSRTPSLRIAWT